VSLFISSSVSQLKLIRTVPLFFSTSTSYSAGIAIV
jgi:hypothetical protein